MADKTISASELSSHNSVDNGGLWITIDGSVYDLTSFSEEHPGGSKILKRVGGKDASKQFWKVKTAINDSTFGTMKC